MLLKSDSQGSTWFAWWPIRADAGPNAPSGLVWLETVAVGYEEHGLGRTFYRRLARPSPTPWGDAMRARRAARRNVNLRQPPPQKCAGECLGNPEPTYYQTPPDKRMCANLREDGPTPCWYPHCMPRKVNDPRFGPVQSAGGGIA